MDRLFAIPYSRIVHGTPRQGVYKFIKATSPIDAMDKFKAWINAPHVIYVSSVIEF